MDPTSAEVNVTCSGNVDETGGDLQRGSAKDAEMGGEVGEDVERAKSSQGEKSASYQFGGDADEKN